MLGDGVWRLLAGNEVAGAFMTMFQRAGAAGREVHLAAGTRFGYLLVDIGIVYFWLASCWCRG
jgi:hypothetical protein